MTQLHLFGGEESLDKNRRGGGNSVYVTNGASNHCSSIREEFDFYATPPEAVEAFVSMESLAHKILEPSCGQGHISKVLIAHGHDVDSRDLVDRGYGKGGCDFLSPNTSSFDGDVVMNPPYSLALPFVEKALSVVPEGGKVCAFLKLTFAEGRQRRELFRANPPIRVWVSSTRLECGKNGVFVGQSAVAYAWWIFVKGFSGETAMKWFN